MIIRHKQQCKYY